jgi:hypothetical protein
MFSDCASWLVQSGYILKNVYLVILNRGKNMKCEECGYDHTKLEKRWEYTGEINSEYSYNILSNIYDIEVVKDILEHALSFQREPFEKAEVFIHTWRIDGLNCHTCSLTNFKLNMERDKVIDYYHEKGIRVYEIQ